MSRNGRDARIPRWCTAYVVLFAVAVVAAWVWGVPYLERQHPDGDPFWTYFEEWRTGRTEDRNSFVTGYEYVVEQRIPCLVSYRPKYEGERWDDLLAAVETDIARLYNAGITQHLQRHESASLRMLQWIRSEGESKAPDERVGPLMADPYFAQRVAEWEETMPAVVREECGLPPASNPPPAPRFEWPE